jgi:hypothetical protein
MRVAPEVLPANGLANSLVEVLVRDTEGQVVEGEVVYFELGVIPEDTARFTTEASEIGSLTAAPSARPARTESETHGLIERTNARGLVAARYWTPCRDDLADGLVVTIVSWPRGNDWRSVTFRQVDIRLQNAPEDALCLELEPDE